MTAHRPTDFQDVPLLAIQVTPMTSDQVCTWITTRTDKSLLANHNLHSAYLYHTDQQFSALYRRAGAIVIDGAPILALARLKNRQLRARHRIGSTDWIPRLAETGARGTVAVFGATDAANRACVTNLRQILPESDWTIVGLNGFVEDAAAVAWLEATQPTLVLIGLGMPRQEHFLSRHWDRLPPATYANVGGAIDYLGQSTRLAPRWLGAAGLEWAWRLVHSPRKLMHRYLVEPMQLAWVLTFRNRKGTRKGSGT